MQLVYSAAPADGAKVIREHYGFCDSQIWRHAHCAYESRLLRASESEDMDHKRKDKAQKQEIKIDNNNYTNEDKFEAILQMGGGK